MALSPQIDHLSARIDFLSECSNRLAKCLDGNMEVSSEMLTFLKHLNGRLERLEAQFKDSEKKIIENTPKTKGKDGRKGCVHF